MTREKLPISDSERAERRKQTLRKSTAKYHKERIENIYVHVPIGTKEKLRKYLDEETGESLNGFLVRKIEEFFDETDKRRKEQEALNRYSWTKDDRYKNQ